VDVSFHLIIADASEPVLGQELPALVHDGYTSFKVFMTYEGLALSDLEMLNVMSVARDTGALVMVHAENYDAIRFLTNRLERAGKTAPRYHAMSRPIPVEREATHRAISPAELVDVPVMIVHVSSREAAEEIRRAQQKGLKVYGETCPQYLVLTAKDPRAQHGRREVCVPSPPRDVASQEACWEGLQQKVFSLFSSDHCPFRYDDPHGKLTPRGKTSFRWVPNGIPGIETRLPILFSAGVKTGRISLNEFVALTATNHAKTHGLYPRKGTIAVSDADIAIWDAERRTTISQTLMHHGTDYTRTRAWKSRDGRSPPWCAASSWCATARWSGKSGAYVTREKSPLATPRASADGLSQRDKSRSPARDETVRRTQPAAARADGAGAGRRRPRVLRAMSMPMLGQFDPAFTVYHERDDGVAAPTLPHPQSLVVPGQRHGAPASRRFWSLIAPGDKVLVPVFGRFGHLLAEIASRCGGDVVTIEREWGSVFTTQELESAIRRHRPRVLAIVHGDTSTTMAQPLAEIGPICRANDVILYADMTASLGGTDIGIDDWQVDAASAGLQKCLSGPPGSAPITFNQRVADIVNRRKHVEAGIRTPGIVEGNGPRIASNYFDLAMLMDYWGESRLNHHTEATSMLYAARECVRIILAEGLQGCFSRTGSRATRSRLD
jgi:dihydropyrimidinase